MTQVMAKEQHDAGQHGQGQTYLAGLGLDGFGQIVGDDDNEDDVVDAQHDFKAGQGQKGDDVLRFEAWSNLLLWRQE
jgi:hypothetical protein